MSLFIRLLGEDDKGAALTEAVRAVAAGRPDRRVFEVAPESFEHVPGAPFAYWVSESIRDLFQSLRPFESELRAVRQGLATADDFRFVRAAWEVGAKREWPLFAKGGVYAPFYADVHLSLEWRRAGVQVKEFAPAVVRNEDYYFRPGLTWPRRTTSGLALRAMPAGCIFADKGPAAFVAGDDPQTLLALLAVANSAAFRALVALQLAAAEAAARSYEVGVMQRTPVPPLSVEDEGRVAGLARRAWSLKRSLDTAEQTSHAFALPAMLQIRGGILAERAAAWKRWEEETEAELGRIQAEIDERCFHLYGFAPEDRAAALASTAAAEGGEEDAEDEEERP